MSTVVSLSCEHARKKNSKMCDFAKLCYLVPSRLIESACLIGTQEQSKLILENRGSVFLEEVVFF